MTQENRSQWNARPEFWFGLAISALVGFVTVKEQLAVANARHEAAQAMAADIHRRLTVLESRCR